MSQQQREYTTWGIIGAGQGGGRIASQFFTRADNPGINDRIVIANTNDTDIKTTLDLVESQLKIERETVNREHLADFGSESGVGNDFLLGEEMAQEDFPQIFRPVNNTLAGTDAFLYTLGLGGGSGNGSVPYIIEQLARGPDDGDTAEMSVEAEWLRGLNQLALAAWPYEDDDVQQHFNAVCGLSRLLMRENGERNADMTILVSNSHLEERSIAQEQNHRGGSNGGFGANSGYTDRFERVNQQIIPAVDLLISAGRRAVTTIDINDYIRKPQSRGVYHATFGVALDKPTGLSMKKVIETAAENTFVPMDPSTCNVAYVVVRAPEGSIDNGDVTSRRVSKAFSEWKKDIGIRRAVGMNTLTRKRGRDKTMDVLLMLGGFDLDELLEESWDLYEGEKDELSRTDEGRAQLKRVERFEDNLTRYMESLK